jgi:hypothetical protein
VGVITTRIDIRIVGFKKNSWYWLLDGLDSRTHTAICHCSKNTWKFCMIFNKSCAGPRDDPVIKWKLQGGRDNNTWLSRGCCNARQVIVQYVDERGLL